MQRDQWLIAAFLDKGCCVHEAFACAIIEGISEAAALNSPWRSSGSQKTLDGFCSNSESRSNDGASW